MQKSVPSATLKTMEKTDIIVSGLFDFIKKSPTSFHAVEYISRILCGKGFTELSESEPWNIAPGGKYFVRRNGSALISFCLPESYEKAFMLCASHSDSPSFKVKENPERKEAGCVKLNVEKYGGMLIAPWFDRPLSVAGRIVFNDGGRIKEKLVCIDRDLLMIPNLAIHMNREANDGHKIDVQKEIEPVLSLSENVSLLSIISQETGLPKEDILSHDLFLYDRSQPCRWGAEEEFISAPRLDDLECAWASLQGFLSAEKPASIPVYCLFDNEEVGSSTRQGADSTFLSDTLERLSEKLGWSGEDYKIALSKSFMLSADNAHALHPNYAEKADPVNRPLLNGGIVIKYNAAQKYTSDAVTSAFFKMICKKAAVPCQVFTNNSNIPGGSTLGNISQNHVSIPCVDIGLAQWAMHSPYESAGAKDVGFMIKAVKCFFESVV